MRKLRFSKNNFAVLAVTLFTFEFSGFSQGLLTPPGAPVPTMKTLTQIEPRTPISALPYIINSPGSYYVTTNLTGISGNRGITISSGNVTVDLGGFALQGVSGSLVGIYVSGKHTNLVVCNGAVVGWGSHGIDAYSSGIPYNLLFERLTISTNDGEGISAGMNSVVRDCASFGNTGDGISSSGGEIIDCVSRNNGATGFVGNHCSLINCSSGNNGDNGFYLDHSSALNCAADANGNMGVWLESLGNEVRGCRITSNIGRGIYCDSGTSGGVIADCIIANNSDVGIQINGPGNRVTGNNIHLNLAGGIVIYGSNNRMEDNNVQTSGSLWGIGVNASTYTNNVIIRNIVSGSSANYFNPGNNDFGPIGSAATATSPWANISH